MVFDGSWDRLFFCTELIRGEGFRITASDGIGLPTAKIDDNVTFKLGKSCLPIMKFYEENHWQHFEGTGSIVDVKPRIGETTTYSKTNMYGRRNLRTPCGRQNRIAIVTTDGKQIRLGPTKRDKPN